MVRKLKYHEQKLLKKVDFITWKVDNGGKETKVIRRYHIRKPADYTKYNKLSREIRTLSEKIAKLENTDPFRTEAATMLLLKLYDMGLTRNQMDLAVASGVSASSFCRRRLPVVMVKIQFEFSQINFRLKLRSLDKSCLTTFAPPQNSLGYVKYQLGLQMHLLGVAYTKRHSICIAKGM
ncbi:U3 small nucleolar ribonucleoprotein protein IMP3 isoform X3 [Zeugodacus cucurbitae]|uniref:U3 small nucleolar ribonucleoprotein protein IMP3 isoform X3 n=1 Tax=Zeugodacus cucurbitae TaxID=28588 RepID=UPI0023D96F27|nr:U3 small nucleolar ribonucleoprotein protein IMP3 isoform X3 [Zeugodacus cucurbitae]